MTPYLLASAAIGWFIALREDPDSPAYQRTRGAAFGALLLAIFSIPIIAGAAARWAYRRRDKPDGQFFAALVGAAALIAILLAALNIDQLALVAFGN